MNAAEFTAALKDAAHELGFALAGACAAVTPTGFHRLAEWLQRGYAGQMHYLADRYAAYEHPRHVLDGARSLLVLAMHYRTAEPAPCGPDDGRIARYAWGGVDYHDLIHERLKRLAAAGLALRPAGRFRGVVDTAPLLEREFAQLAGLGWVGKNTLLLNRTLGSYFFLAALLTDQELAYDEPFAADHCGVCRACLDACPTGAFPAPYVLDASRCLSYLTIEHRDAVPAELRPLAGDWVFGCDVCQEVCPWNGKSTPAEGDLFRPPDGLNPIALPSLFYLGDDEFRRLFRRSPLWRPRRRGLLRNAALVLGGRQLTAAARVALEHGLADPEPLVREACAWALRAEGRR